MRGHGAPLEFQMTRTNLTQLTLDEAHGERAYQAAVAAITVREAVRPLERRKNARLAALVASMPILDRRGR